MRLVSPRMTPTYPPALPVTAKPTHDPRSKNWTCSSQLVVRRRTSSLLIPKCPFARLPLWALWRCGSAHSTEATPPLIVFDRRHELLMLPPPSWCNVALEGISQRSHKTGTPLWLLTASNCIFFVMFFTRSFCSLFHFGFFYFIYLFIYFWCCKRFQKTPSVSFPPPPVISAVLFSCRSIFRSRLRGEKKRECGF